MINTSVLVLYLLLNYLIFNPPLLWQVPDSTEFKKLKKLLDL